ncbi:MAG: 2-C-methyl-D-erythritol 4-phosphate cytidylyltransferase [Planctomycetota bacterium]|nr:2-C-methyl-D-erythritol 4-phosphate cytidylyltransferase [Planctomycetota bacterium]
MAKFSVIVVAAGKGQRFGGKESKIFAKLDGQVLFLRALQLFVGRDDVCETILVVSPSEIEQIREKFGPNIGFMGAKMVAGGAERFESVANGLAEVSDQAEYVAVHDAVRVCVSELWIDTIFEAAAKNGTAVPAIPVNATLKRVGEDGTISETVPRDGLYIAQTPQVFRKDILQSAFEWYRANTVGPVTDDAQLVAAAGHTVSTVEGDPRNVKITTKPDLSMAAALLKILPQKKVDRLGVFEDAQW